AGSRPGASGAAGPASGTVEASASAGRGARGARSVRPADCADRSTSWSTRSCTACSSGVSAAAVRPRLFAVDAAVVASLASIALDGALLVPRPAPVVLLAPGTPVAPELWRAAPAAAANEPIARLTAAARHAAVGESTCAGPASGSWADAPASLARP